MEQKQKRLPDAELEIMVIVWAQDAPVSSSFILERLEGRRWGLQTLLTVLSRLTEKGFLSCEKQGRYNLYRAAVAEDDYKRAEGKSLLARLYGNSFRNLVASLYDGEAITREDLAEMRRYLDEMEER